eukprot:gene5727-5967_t
MLSIFVPVLVVLAGLAVQGGGGGRRSRGGKTAAARKAAGRVASSAAGVRHVELETELAVLRAALAEAEERQVEAQMAVLTLETDKSTLEAQLQGMRAQKQQLEMMLLFGDEPQPVAGGGGMATRYDYPEDEDEGKQSDGDCYHQSDDEQDCSQCSAAVEGADDMPGQQQDGAQLQQLYALDEASGHRDNDNGSAFCTTAISSTTGVPHIVSQSHWQCSHMLKRMKKLIGSTINSISTSTANAVNTVSKQLDKTLAQQEQHALPTPQSEKQYLRLPVESAKKLRWYDKADLAQLTRQHVREKHLLLDTITALKKVMIRAGFTDASLDDEARQLVSAAESLRLADQGTESVLLVALQVWTSSSINNNNGMLAALEVSGVSPGTSQQPLDTADGGGGLSAAEQPAAHTANGISAVPTTLAKQLQHSYSALEAAEAEAAAVAEQDTPGLSTASPAGVQAHTTSSSSSAASDPVASAAIIQRYRDYNLQLEERCRASERNSTLLGARVASLEESLAVAQQTLAAKQQQAAAAEVASRQQ